MGCKGVFITRTCFHDGKSESKFHVHGMIIQSDVFNDKDIMAAKTFELLILIKSQQSLFVCLFDLMLYIQGKQLRSCHDGQLLNHTVPGQASWRQFTSIKCPFFSQ